MEVVLMVSVAEQVLSALTSVMTMLVSAFRDRGTESHIKVIATTNKAARSAFLFEMSNKNLFFALRNNQNSISCRRSLSPYSGISTMRKNNPPRFNRYIGTLQHFL